jgi:hypothetical protein
MASYVAQRADYESRLYQLSYGFFSNDRSPLSAPGQRSSQAPLIPGFFGMDKPVS